MLDPMQSVQSLPDYANDCGWYHNLPQPAVSEPLKGLVKADIAIVGSGFTGLAAARRLAELAPDKHIVLLDAMAVGMASAGRNSGFMIDLPHALNSHSYTTDLSHDHNIIAFNRSGIAYAKSIVKQHNIACDWSESGKIHGATSANGAKSLDSYGQGLAALGEPFSHLSRQQMQDTTGLNYYHSGVFTPGTVLIQPAAFVRGCAQHLPANVTLYENTPVTAYQWGHPNLLTTPHGQVSAGQVLLCNNGFAQAFGEQQGRLVHVCTYASMTAAMTAEQQQRLGGDQSWGLIPAHPAGATIRRTPDQRLLVRSVITCNPKLSYRHINMDKVKAQHQVSYKRRFSALPDLQFEHTWGGLLCLSGNEASYFGQCQEGVYAAVCQNGLGVARGTAAGKLLAEMALGHDSELLRQQVNQSGPSWLPPKPLSDWAVNATLMIYKMRAGREA